MHTRNRVHSVIAMAMAILMVFAGTALADDVTNDLDNTVDATLEVMNLTVGGSNGATKMKVSARNGDKLNGCNFQNGGELVVSVASSNTAVASVSPSSLTFKDCEVEQTVTVTPLSAGSGTVSLTEISNTTQGRQGQQTVPAEFDVRPASFSVNVAAPAKQSQTITFVQPASPVAYGNTFSVAPTASSGLAVDVTASGPCTISSGTVTITSGSGNCTLTASQGGNTSYDAAPTVVHQVAAAKRPASVTPLAASKTYGDTDPALSGTLSGFLAADNISATYSRAAGESVAGSPYTISATLQGDLSNYDVTYNTANFTMNKRAASVTPDAKSKTYGEADPTLSGTLVGFLTADNISAAYDRAAGETVAGSPYIISASLQGDLSNYDVTYKNAQFTIDKRPITVTADAKSKVFGATDPALTWNLTSGNLVGSDLITGSLSRNGVGTTAGEAVGTHPILQGSLTAGSNYELTYGGANLTITAWHAEGFYSPIGRANSIVQAPGTPVPAANANTVWNTGKGGSTLPLKFKVFDGLGGSERTDTWSVKSFTATTLTCPANGSTDAMEEADLLPSNIGNSLKYDGEQFHQNWKTSKVTKDTCYRVGVTLQDGTSLYTFVRLLR